MIFFFKWRFPVSHTLLLFQDSFIFGEATSSNFFRVTQHLLFWSGYVYKAAAFYRSSFFRTITSSQQLFFRIATSLRTKLLLTSHFLRKESSLGQLLFGTATFLVEESFRIKISTEELLFRSRYFCTTSTFSDELYFAKS